MAQEIVFGCMYALQSRVLVLAHDLTEFYRRDWFLADRLQQKGAKNVYTFR